MDQLPDNARRARRIVAALDHDPDYAHHLKAGDPETAITDALTDLQHWADAEDLAFDELLATARGHYQAEALGVEPWSVIDDG